MSVVLKLRIAQHYLGGLLKIEMLEFYLVDSEILIDRSGLFVPPNFSLRIFFFLIFEVLSSGICQYISVTK